MPYEGRVEIIHEGVWGGVCSTNFDDIDASVVCSQLGFGGVGIAVTSEFSSSLPVWLTNVGCLGTEQSLLECSTGKLTSAYCYRRNAGVKCSGKQTDALFLKFLINFQFSLIP